LHDLQNKKSPPSFVFIFLDLWARPFFGQLLRAVLVRSFLLSQVVEQLADSGILSPHFPSLHQLIAFVQNHVPLKRYQMVEHFQTAVARAGFAFLAASAKSFVPEGVVLRAPSFRIRPLETFALWSNGNVNPLNEAKARRRLFVLQIVQLGLAGLMDGSESTLAPVFAAVFSACSVFSRKSAGLVTAAS
jgi:hypothetical protein